MIDFSREELTSGRPEISAREAVEFCLDALLDDDRHEITETLTHSPGECLTYEELIGALLLARDELERGP